MGRSHDLTRQGVKIASQRVERILNVRWRKRSEKFPLQNVVLNGTGFEDFGQSPIEDGGYSIITHHDVGWLQVAVNDTVGVRKSHSLTDLKKCRKHGLPLRYVIDCLADRLFHGFPTNEIHDDVSRTGGINIEIVDSQDTRVPKLTRDSRFAKESRRILCAVFVVFLNDLDSNLTLQLHIPAPINEAHTAFPNLLTNPVS